MRKAKQTYHEFSVRLRCIQKKRIDFKERGKVRAENDGIE